MLQACTNATYAAQRTTRAAQRASVAQPRRIGLSAQRDGRQHRRRTGDHYSEYSAGRPTPVYSLRPPAHLSRRLSRRALARGRVAAGADELCQALPREPTRLRRDAERARDLHKVRAAVTGSVLLPQQRCRKQYSAQRRPNLYAAST